MNSPSQLSEYSTVGCNQLDMLDSLAIVVIPRKQFHLLIATNQSQEIPRSWKMSRNMLNSLFRKFDDKYPISISSFDANAYTSLIVTLLTNY